MKDLINQGTVNQGTVNQGTVNQGTVNQGIGDHQRESDSHTGSGDDSETGCSPEEMQTQIIDLNLRGGLDPVAGFDRGIETGLVGGEAGESLRIPDHLPLDPAPSAECRAVLVVEDDPVIVELLQDALVTSGFFVRVAKHATDAVELFAHHAHETFCIILDYGIPGMHASRLLERLTEIDPEVKVILSSGYPQNFIVEDFPLERISGFMAKPYDPQILISELRRLLRENSQTSHPVS